MDFRFYTNQLRQASRNVTGGIFLLGLVFIGMGFLIYILRDLFAILFTALFFMLGIGCCVFAVRMFFAQRRLDKFAPDDSQAYRKNVQIHIEEHHDI
jgi:hypothetical protein